MILKINGHFMTLKEIILPSSKPNAWIALVLSSMTSCGQKLKTLINISNALILLKVSSRPSPMRSQKSWISFSNGVMSK